MAIGEWGITMRSKLFEEFLNTSADINSLDKYQWKFINAVGAEEMRYYVINHHGRIYEDEASYLSGLAEMPFTDENVYNKGMLPAEMIPTIMDQVMRPVVKAFLLWRLEKGV